MGRRGWAVVLVACLLLAAVALGRAWTSTHPPGVGVQVTQASEGSNPDSTAVAPQGGATGDAGPPAARAEPAPEPEPSVAPTSDPVLLSVPSLGVDAPVDPVGVEEDGSMTIPRDGSRVGWYQWGPAPGADAGSAVLAGHVDTRAGGPGALFRLAELELGDELLVTDADGRELAYRVVGRETITKSALPVERLFARDGPHVLTVITCGGPFQPELRSYRDNVVILAEPVGENA